MDIFYKPPLQRQDECEALETNYMNCLVQKALKDRVLTNKCVLDSILWFHLECPKSVAKFDDKVEFKRKFRDFLAIQKTHAENVLTPPEDAQRIAREYSFIQYPEDIKVREDVRDMQTEWKEYDPELRPESADEWENEVVYEQDEPTPISERKYGTTLINTRDITVSDSAKFSKEEYAPFKPKDHEDMLKPPTQL